MYKKRSARNRRLKKKKNGLRLLLLLLTVTGVVAGSLYLYSHLTEHQRERSPQERRKMPPRVVQPDTLHGYSSSVEAVHEDFHGKRRSETARAKTGRIAIIVDDMGSSIAEEKALAAIGVPMTVAVIPGLPKCREVARAASGHGLEVIMHIPMEPKGYPGQKLERNGLLLTMGKEEIDRRMTGLIQLVPNAVGANNHMGSRFTENREKMAAVMEVLKERSLFFVDSRTSPVSVGEKVAKEMGVATASRNVFLDNVQEVAAIKVQLVQLSEMAVKHGSAIGICHPHGTTLQALAEALPKMRSDGITFVKVSTLVR